MNGARESGQERRLALEIRSWKFGYALFEGKNLLDWGVSRFPGGVRDAAIRSLKFLLKSYTPAIVIARRTRDADDQSSVDAAGVLRSIRREVERQSVGFVVLGRREVHDFFAERGHKNKYQIANAVCEHFGELKSLLPPPRKPWDPEDNRTAIFDAVATAIAFREKESH